MYRKGSYIAARIAGFFAIVLLGCAVAVQTPFVQTRITLKVLDRLTAAMDGRIEYGEFRVMPSGVLLLKDAVVLDDNPYTEDIYGRGWERADTLFRARTVTATFSLSSLFGGGGIHINRVNVSDAMLHIAAEPGEYPTNLERMFRMPAQTETPEPGPEIFRIRKVRIRNFRFRLSNFMEALSVYPGYGIYYDDIDLTADINGHSLRFSGGRMYGVADKVTLTEKSGYRLLRASGRCVAGQGKTLVENFRLLDPWSKLNVKSFSMTYDSPAAFNNFIEEVLMECELRRSEIGVPTLKYLAGMADGIDARLDVRGCRFKGYVNDFRFDGLNFTDMASGVSGEIGGDAIGLPDIGRMMASLKIKDLEFDSAGLTSMLSQWLPDAGLPDLSEYAPGVRFSLDADIEGPPDRLRLDALLHSSAGDIRIGTDIRNLMESSRGIEISGAVDTDGLGLGSIVPGLPFGDCTLEARASARLDNGMSRIRIDTLGISSVDFRGREYSGIRASGSFMDNTLNCRVESTDPTLRLKLAALARIGGEDGRSGFRVSGNIENIDLHKLGIDTRKGVSRIALDSIDADISAVDDLLDGFAGLGGIRVENGNGTTEVGDIDFLAFTRDGIQHIGLDSPFAAVSFSGGGTVADFVSAVQEVSLRRHLPSVYDTDSSAAGTGAYRLDAVFHDTRKLMSFVMPGLYISDSTSLSLSISDDGILEGSIRSPRLAFGRDYLKDVDMSLSSMQEYMEAGLSGSELRAGNIMVGRPALAASASDDRFNVALNFDSFAGGGRDGRLLMEGGIARDSTGTFMLDAHPLDSYLATADGMWVFDESQISYNGSELKISGFKLSKGGQMISLEGGWSREKADTLSLVAKDIDLSIIDEFLPESLGIRGRAGGRVLLTSGDGLLPGMLVNFRLDSLGIGTTDAGQIRIASALGEEREDVSILLRHSIEGRTALYADGDYSLESGDLSLDARLDSLPLSIAAPFLSEVFDELGGSVSGGVSMARNSGGFSVSGDGLHLNDVRLGLAFTGVDYVISGPMRLDDGGLHFDDMLVSDMSEGSGTISGTLTHRQLEDFELSSRLSLDNLKVVDAPEGGSSGIYGLLRASGYADVNGPLNALGVNAAIRTSGTGNIHIPASESISSSTSNLLTFTEAAKPVDPYDEMLSDYSGVTAPGGDMDIQARITAHPGVTAYIELDKSAGSLASFSGEGSVNLHLRPSAAIFDINGEYNISEGNYTFSIPGILSRDFEIQEGSRVMFSGSIPDSELDIDAIYRLKTSLSSLIAESDSDQSIGTSREVECGINISDRVRNPRLSFSIDVPDLNPTVKSQVESALNTDDKVQKQFLALLLLGSFIPDEQSGVVNGSDILLSNVTELMSNQLNSILQKLDIPLDVGIGYQGAASGTNVFDVAISTQLFNNRVIVGGNVGNRRYGSSADAGGDVVGDLDIQIKLDPEGKFRLNLFSHSADEYSNYLDYSQRNGVGVSYQKEFARFGSLFRPSDNEASDTGEQPSEKAQAVIRIEEDEQGETISDTGSAGRQ